MMYREETALQTSGMDRQQSVIAAHQAAMDTMFEAQRTLAWVMDEHFATLLRNTTWQVQTAYREMAAAQARAALAEARAAAYEARAARAESIIAMLKQELGQNRA